MKPSATNVIETCRRASGARKRARGRRGGGGDSRIGSGEVGALELRPHGVVPGALHAAMRTGRGSSCSPSPPPHERKNGTDSSPRLSPSSTAADADPPTAEPARRRIYRRRPPTNSLRRRRAGVNREARSPGQREAKAKGNGSGVNREARRPGQREAKAKGNGSRFGTAAVVAPPSDKGTWTARMRL
jgi:hypothetical protein